MGIDSTSLALYPHKNLRVFNKYLLILSENLRGPT